MKKIDKRFKPILFAVALVLVSWLCVRTGIALGNMSGMPHGSGDDLRSGVHEDLFRFDAEYYYDIARNGYSYNGDPYSSPNIVFAPAFPTAIWITAMNGLDEVIVGFALNKLFLLGAVVLLFLYLRDFLGEKKSLLVLFAMLTAAGSYSFHAYYSESLMLFLISLCLFAHKEKNWPLLAIGAALLGATRITALPMVGVISAFFLIQAYLHKKNSLLFLICAAVCPLGLAAYFGFIAYKFANPLELFPEIQGASWGFFHPPIEWIGLLTGWNLLQYWVAALSKGVDTLFDPKTINLLWTTLAGASAIFTAIRFKRSLFTGLFVSYFIFIYFTNSSSDFLISSHRFFVLMLPIFVMFSGFNRWTTGLLLLLNLSYGLFHTAYFNNGVWYYF